MNYIKICLVLLIVMSSQSATFSKDIYLRYDPACMDRYEYRFTSNSKGNAVYAYALKGNEGQSVVLEVGVESNKPLNRIPKATLSCRGIQVSEALVDQINSGKDKMFIVRRSGSNYIVSPVHLAIYFKVQKGGFYTKGKDFDFNFQDNNQGAYSINLAANSSPSSIFFMGNAYSGCQQYFEFKKIPEAISKPFTDMSIIPGIGILEEKTGLTPIEAQDNAVRLVSINNMPVADYFRIICEQQDQPNTSNYDPTNKVGAEIIVKYTPPVSYNEESQVINTGADIPVSYEVVFATTKEEVSPEFSPAEESFTSKGGNVVFDYDETLTPDSYSIITGFDCDKLPSAGIHIIRPGESLWSISRNYGVTVKQLKNWNKLGSKDLIRPCSELKVLAPQALKALQDQGDLAEKGGINAEVLFKSEKNINVAPSITDSDDLVEKGRYKIEPGVSYTNSRGNTLSNTAPQLSTNTSNINTGTTPLWTLGFQQHMVQQGETMASIARKYGYTLERLLYMNGLNESDIIQTGQIIKVSDCSWPDGSAANYTSPTYEPEPITSSSPSTANDFSNATNESLTSKGSAEPTPDEEEKELEPVPIPYSYDAVMPIIQQSQSSEQPVITRNGKRIHTVKENETLASIATKYNIPVETLRALNNMEKGEIVIPFQKIYLE